MQPGFPPPVSPAECGGHPSRCEGLDSSDSEIGEGTRVVLDRARRVCVGEDVLHRIPNGSRPAFLLIINEELCDAS